MKEICSFVLKIIFLIMALFSFVINGEYFGLLYSVSLDQHNCGNKNIFLRGLCGTEFHNF